MPDPIRFYFDFSSPYGYLASQRIGNVAARHGRTVDWHPILLGFIFRVTGQTPLLDQPMRGAYFTRDMQRTAREWGVPLVMPEHFPFHSVAASRAFYWLKESAPDRAVAFANAIYGAYWGQGRDVDKPEQVAEVAAGLGLDGDALREALGEGAVKDRLKAEMDAAMGQGVFGSPTMLVDGEMFFGCDKFEQMERWLESGGW
jgi:2-hydroxychromene-2-carboxylate isomerase